MVEVEKWPVFKVKNPQNLDVYQFYEIPSILCSIYIVLLDKNSVIYYVNNYIDWDLFNQLYDPK